MGIDSFDVAFRLEKHFGIEFRPDDAIYLWESPRRIIQLVTARLSGEILPIPDFDACTTMIDTALKSLPDYRCRWFRSDLAAEFPSENREQNWRAFGESLGCELPPLQPVDSGPAKLPRECGTHLRLTFWLLDNAPDGVPYLPANEALPVPDDAARWDAESIQRGVFDVLVDVLGLDDDEVTLDADMSTDLGME